MQEKDKCGKIKEAGMEIKIFKIKNRKGYAAICCGHLTEGKTPEQTRDRMQKALKRKKKK